MSSEDKIKIFDSKDENKTTRIEMSSTSSDNYSLPNDEIISITNKGKKAVEEFRINNREDTTEITTYEPIDCDKCGDPVGLLHESASFGIISEHNESQSRVVLICGDCKEKK